MTMPDVWCEIAFVKDSDDGSPLWRDVTADVEWQEGVRISRRRSHELDEIQPGTLSLTLNNPDGHYTAGNTASQWYPNVKINRPIRIRARWPVGSVNRLLEGQAKGSDATLFSASQGTVSVDTTVFPAGQTSSARWNPGTLISTGMLFRFGPTSTTTATSWALEVKTGTSYSFRCQIRRDASFAVSVSARIRWYNVSGTFLSESAGSVVALSTTFQALSVSAAAPANAVFARVAVVNTTTSAGAVQIYVSAAQFEQAASPSTWVSPGTEYVEYQGFTDKWPHVWENGVRGKVTLTATDRMKLLARQRISREVLVEETLATTPLLYYPLGEPAGTTAAGNQAATPQPDLAIFQRGAGGALTFGETEGPLGSAMVRFEPVDLTNGKCLYTPSLSSPLGGGTALTVSAWIECVDSPPVNDHASAVYVWHPSGAPWHRFGYWYGAGRVDFGSHIGGLTAAGSFILNLQDGQPHHVVFTGEFSGGSLQLRMWVDGVQQLNVGTAINGSSWPTGLSALSAGGQPVLSGAYETLFPGLVSQVAAWNRALSTTEIASLYDVGSATTELSGARISRVLGWAGVADTAIDAGQSELDISAYGTAGSSLQDIREAALSDGGVFFIARDGVSTFHDRARRQTSGIAPTFALTADQCGTDLNFLIDDTLLFNDITVSRKGASTRVTNNDSIDEYGQYTHTVDTVLASDTEAIQRGQLMLASYAEPAPRAGQITIEARSMPTLWPTLLSCEIGHRLTVTGLPASAPASSMSLWVEGVQQVITDETWHFTLDTSPSGFGTALLLDDPVLGLLDSNSLGW